MPIQENEDVKKHPEIEENEHKSETLLPIFNVSYDNQMDRLDDLQECKAEIQDKISKGENKIAVLEEKATRLDATNAMLNELIDSGRLPKITLKIVRANEDKIKSINERQIPKLENSIQKNTNKVAKLDDRIAVTQLKAQKLRSFSNLIKSFVIPNPTLRRELFTEAMNGLRNSTKGLLNIEMNAEKVQLAKLSKQYENDDSMSEKYKLGKKIEAVKANISTLESKINKLGKSQKLSEINDHAVDKTIAKTESEIENYDFFSKDTTFDFDKPIETFTLNSAEYLRNAEMSMEDDFSMIDGIINNGKKEQERPDIPLFLEEIDFATCNDATIQDFRGSAKANQECAKEIAQAISQNYDVSRWSLNSEQALNNVREKFSDDRIAYVLANALNGTADGRVSQEVRDFVKSKIESVPKQFQKRNLSLDSANPGLVNLFAKTFMKSQAEREIAKPEPEKKVGLLSFEQFGETRFRVVDETANDILKLANSNDKPFAALNQLGKAVSETEFAEIMQSTQAKFSVDINLDSDTVQLMAVNRGQGGIAEGNRNDSNTYHKTAKLTDFVKSELTQEQKKEPEAKEVSVPKKTVSKTRKINPGYYKQIPKEDRVIVNEPAKVGATIMSELEKKKIPFSAVETSKGVTITVSKENEGAFKAAEDKAKDTHVRLVNPEVFKQIPKEARTIRMMPETEARDTMQKLEKDGIAYSARIDGEKSAVTVRKSEAPAYFSRKQMKKLAQEVKGEKPAKTSQKSKGQEL